MQQIKKKLLFRTYISLYVQWFNVECKLNIKFKSVYLPDKDLLLPFVFKNSRLYHYP